MIRAWAVPAALFLATAPAAVAQDVPERSGPSIGEVTVSYIDGYYSDVWSDRSLMRRAEPRFMLLRRLKGSAYPAAALGARSTGVVGIVVRVGASDRIAGCEVTRPASDSRLTTAACPLIARHVTFRHALGVDGSPRVGVVDLDIRFTLTSKIVGPVGVYVPPEIRVKPPERPVQMPQPLDPDALVIHGATPSVFPEHKPAVRLDLNATGAVTRCRVQFSAGTDQGDMRMCRQALGVRFSPRIDQTGAPTPLAGYAVDFTPQP